MVVEGSAGIGKTRLLSEARALAAAEEFEVLTARGGELKGSSRSGSCGSCSRLRWPPRTGAARRAACGRRRAERVAVRVSRRLPWGEGAESSFAMLHGLYWLAANVASRTPTLVVVDDLHWADEPSLRWLVYLARRLEGLPCCC